MELVGRENEEALIESNKKVEEKKIKYPKHIFLIIGNEFCERFSYYGMRTVLVLYARNFLLFDADTSTAVFHAFTFLAYFFPLVGGAIADSYWGKYRTILYLSLLYVLGHAVKTIAAIPYIPSNAAHISLSMLGLLFIAIGTGGIKPCVSSFGGDQFHPSQEKQISQFFAMFYFSINAGALLSKLVTPMFRADLKCYPGQTGHLYDECYAMAFGIPGLLMLVALIFFVAGTKLYTRVPLSGSVFWRFCKCVCSALANKWKAWRGNHEKKEHWIDYAKATDKMKRDSKYALKVLLLFTPLPFFWALFDQQGSRWTLQALELDGYWGDVLVKPDQMDVANPLLIITLIPLCEFGLYPLLRHCKIDFNPIRRMTAGLFLAGISFIFTAILQFNIDSSMTPLPSASQFSVRVINMGPCDITLTSSDPNFDGLIVKSGEWSSTKEHFLDADLEMTLSHVTCAGDVINRTLSGRGERIDLLIYGKQGQMSKLDLIPTHRLENGKATARFIKADEGAAYSVKSSGETVVTDAGLRSTGVEVPRGRSSFSVFENSSTHEILNATLDAKPAGVYTILIENGRVHQMTDMNPNTINIAWMFPQYLVLTIGEVFLSITGLEFSYTQAPPSMKAVVSSFWLLTVAFGNLIVLIVAKVSLIERQAHEFILFACLIGVAGVIFMFLARGYIIVREDEFDEDSPQTKKLSADANGGDVQLNSEI